MKSPLPDNLENTRVRAGSSHGPVGNTQRIKIKVWSGVVAVAALLCGSLPHNASALSDGDAKTSIDAFNAAFLVTYNSGNSAAYVTSLSDSSRDYFWQQAADIEAMEDALEHTGSSAHEDLVNKLCATFLVNWAPPWTWDSWNDDCVRVAEMLARGYLLTGTTNFLTQAKYGFNIVYNRGWDTASNGGGIWEKMNDPNVNLKEALSTNNAGYAAALIYLGSGDSTYLTKAKSIYSWSRSHIYNATTGKVYRGVAADGTVDTTPQVYNQGTFIDYANILYQITGDSMYYDDAKLALDYTINNTNFSDSNGILKNVGRGQFPRAIGHFVASNRLWTTYYAWMLANANTGWAHRRTDLNIAETTWSTQTQVSATTIPSVCASIVGMLQVTPSRTPPSFAGTHYLFNKYSGRVLENPNSSTANGTLMQQWGYTGAANQQWTFTRNSDDGSYTIKNVASGRVLDVVGASTTAGARIQQWGYTGGNSQRWFIWAQQDGFYNIQNKASGRDMEVYGMSTSNGGAIDQWDNNDGPNQRWKFQD